MSTYLVVGLGCFAFASIRYLAMTGAYYFVVYRFFYAQLEDHKIQPGLPSTKMMKHEIYWALLNNVNFAILGMFGYFLYQQGLFQVYFDLAQQPLWFYPLQIFGLLLAHDAYFYWIHWLMHKTRFGKWARHDIHHGVDNVSPWSAFSVHPREGFVEVFFRIVVLMTVPMHPLIFIGFELLTFALNIVGHSGYEFFPSWFARAGLTRMKSCATFHYMHHLNGGTNFSLFFNHWDRLMGTMNPDYEKFYAEKVKRRVRHDQRPLHSEGLAPVRAMAAAPNEFLAPVPGRRDPGGRDLT